MRSRQSLTKNTLPNLWLISDARNDQRLEPILRELPRGSGLIFRHYHLDEPERRRRFALLARIARGCGHLVVLSGSMRQARRWGADGAYGGAERIGRGASGIRLITVHSLKEIASAQRAGANAVLLSPVFDTRSHPGAKVLGPIKFRMLAARSSMPVIALGGMNSARARRCRWPRWAAIDGI